MSPLSTSAAFERELRHVLIRHLPVGLEGIGIAQCAAVLTMVQRRETHRARAAVNDTERSGLRILKEAAHAHAVSAHTLDGHETVCGICHDPDGTPDIWPCPVWTSAELLGLVHPPTVAQVG